MRRRYWLLILLALGLGLGIPLLVGGKAVWQVLARLQAYELLLLLGMIVLAWNCNAGRVRLLAAGMKCWLTQWQALSTIMATEFAICATPGGAGGPVTYTWLLHRLGIPSTRGMALYAVDQLFDMVFFVTALLGFSLYWLFVPSKLEIGWQVAILAALLTLGLGLAWGAIRHYRHWLLWSVCLLRWFRISAADGRRMARWTLEFRNSLQRVRRFSPYSLLGVYLLCVGHWLLRYSVLYLAVHAVGGSIQWSHAFVVQMLALTAGQLTLLPGGSGGAEASSTLLLLPYMDAATAAGAILVWRFATFYWYLLAGAPVFALLTGPALWRRLG